MSTPPPVPPGMPEIPPVPGVASVPPPVPPAPAQSFPPVPPTYPSGPPPVFYPPVVSPQSTSGSSTRGLLYGCLGLLAGAGILIAIGSVWAFKKAKVIVENPEQFIAEMAVKGNPDLELVSVDRTAQEVVIRDRNSGESTTFSFEEVRNGKLTLKKSDGSSAEFGPDGIRVQDKDGLRAVLGAGDAVPLPEWVPAYPGEHRVLKSSHQLKGANGRGQYSFTTPDRVNDSAAGLVKVLEAAGFEVTRESAAADGSRVVLLEATATPEGGGRERISVRMMAQGKETMVHLDCSHEESASEESVEK